MQQQNYSLSALAKRDNDNPFGTSEPEAEPKAVKPRLRIRATLDKGDKP